MPFWKTMVVRGACMAYRCMRIQRPPRAARVLMYHAIGSPVDGDVQGRYNLTPGLFRRHMHALRVQFSRSVVDFSSQVSDGEVSITFDDGYRDTLEVAAPILVEMGMRFSVFVAPEFVRSGSNTYLSLDGLRELAAVPGATIGAHGDRHVRLTACSDAELERELVGSRVWLEDALACEIRTMSYPHGAVDTRVRDATAMAGYVLAASSDFGARKPSDDLLRIPRTDVWATDTESVFLEKLNGDWDWLRWRNAAASV